jgi:hypothetical protein
MASKDAEFLKWNFRNILTNTLQTEDHLKILEPTGNPGHHSCVQKHMLIVSGELGEAISHSSTTKPEITNEIKRIKKKVDNAITEFEKGIKNPIETLKKVRSIRKEVESLNPNFNTSNCNACGNFESIITKKILTGNPNDTKDLNTPNTINRSRGVKTMVNVRQIATFTGSQLVGEGVSDFVLPQLDTTFGTSGMPAFQRASIWAGILGGLALQIMSSRFSGERSQIASAVIGSHMFSDALSKSVQEGAIGGAAAPRVVTRAPAVRIPPPAARATTPAKSIPEFPDSAGVTVD